jgi:hypothetical protein
VHPDIVVIAAAMWGAKVARIVSIVARATGHVSIPFVLKAVDNATALVASKLAEVYGMPLASSLSLKAGEKSMLSAADTLVASSVVDAAWTGQHDTALCACRHAVAALCT